MEQQQQAMARAQAAAETRAEQGGRPVYGGSFSSAFAQAHRDLGPNREFVWQATGTRYHTNRADGRDMSRR
jgi:hypothetical protein